jgi:hypothetical protein
MIAVWPWGDIGDDHVDSDAQRHWDNVEHPSQMNEPAMEQGQAIKFLVCHPGVSGSSAM